MMNDNISRQAVLDILKYDVWHDKIEAIEALPSTDRKGNWLEGNGKLAEGLHGVYCSECGEESEYRGLYCPECGAFMMNEDRRRKDDKRRSRSISQG